MKIFFTLLCLIPGWGHAEIVHHNLSVRISPETHQIWASDVIRLPAGSKDSFYTFSLNPGLQVTSANARLEAGGVWRVPVLNEIASVDFEGIINDPVRQENTSGLIDAEGVALMGSSRWYPTRESDSLTFDLNVVLPPGWSHVTQTSNVKQPQEEIYLIAGKFSRYDQGGHSVYLRQPDEKLAKSYLDLLPNYLGHYSNLIAPYPYGTFRVVENFFETGYGMPSFTLLGPSVIRLPFLLKSSFPHEVLHNWWGNSVYVDWNRGNWSEGLTTYLADHWQQVELGTDAEYRRTTLATFQDFVRDDNDFPLRQFKGRHDAGSQAVGYGKSMFLFHMLAGQMGEGRFRDMLRVFYGRHVFQRVSFEEIERAAQDVAGENLHGFFSQWLDRTGMPRIEIENLEKDGRNLKLRLRQTSAQGEVYALRIPVRLSLLDGSEQKDVLNLDQISQEYLLAGRSEIKKLNVDGGFDVFRALSEDERPPTLARAFSNPEPHFVMSSNQAGAKDFFDAWKNSGVGGDIWEKEKLPTSGALVFIGTDLRAEQAMKQPLSDYGVEVRAGVLRIGTQEYQLKDHAFALAARSSSGQSLLWINWPQGLAADTLAKRLLHYGSFGAVVFQGNANVLKKPWPVVRSPLIREF